MSKDDRKDRGNTLMGLASPPPPPRPGDPTSILDAEIRARAPQEAMRYYKQGAIIKEAGVSHDAAYVIVDGCVHIEVDATTSKGSTVFMLGVANKHDILNEAKLFGFDGTIDARKRYRANTDVYLMELVPPQQLGGIISPQLLHAIVRSLVRRGADLTRMLAREIGERHQREEDLRNQGLAWEKRVYMLECVAAEAEGLLAEQNAATDALRSKLERALQELSANALHTGELVTEYEEKMRAASADAFNFFLETTRALNIALTPQQIQLARAYVQGLMPTLGGDDVDQLLDAAFPGVDATPLAIEIDVDETDEDPDDVPSRRTYAYGDLPPAKKPPVDDDVEQRTGRYDLSFLDGKPKQPKG